MVEVESPRRKALATAVFRGAVAVVAALSLVPLAVWIPGGPEGTLTGPQLPLYLFWLVGLAVLAAAAWGLARWAPGGAWGTDTAGSPARDGARRRGRRKGAPGADAASPKAAAQREASGPEPARRLRIRWTDVALLAGPTLLYAFTAWAVFDGRPLHVDAMTQAVQAHVFAEGRLSVPVAEEPRFFSSALMVEHGGRVFSQFPPGWAALLALGFLTGLPWLVAPLCGALAAWALHRLLREAGEPEGRALGAAALMALSPWFTFNAASWMSHVPTLTFILLGSLALVRGMRGPGEALWAALGGAGLGAATLIRPLEGVAFGLPATVWVLARALRSPPARRAAAGFAAGGALSVGLLLAHNLVMHGSPTLFGFELQWGPEHRLGFHEAPWGPPHTFVRGLQLVNGYLLALQAVFFDAPAPSLLAALAALLLVRALSPLDRYLLAGGGLVLLGYLAFWGEGHDLGPRYLIPLAPIVALWSVRLGAIVAERTGVPFHRRWAHAFVVLLLVSGWLMGTRPRWYVYGQSDPLRRLDAAALTLPQAREGLVFVSAPWSGQVLARLRDVGLDRQEAQWFYYRVGLCKLDVALAKLEAEGVDDPARVRAALLPLAADSASMVLDPMTGSPGDPYTGLTQSDSATVAVCGLRQYLEERQGGIMLLPLQAMVGPTWTGDGPVVAQDLHEGNRRLLEAYPDRPAYRLRPAGTRGRVRHFTLEPLKADSVERVWAEFERLQREARVF